MGEIVDKSRPWEEPPLLLLSQSHFLSKWLLNNFYCTIIFLVSCYLCMYVQYLATSVAFSTVTVLLFIYCYPHYIIIINIVPSQISQDLTLSFAS